MWLKNVPVNAHPFEIKFDIAGTEGLQRPTLKVRGSSVRWVLEVMPKL